MIDEEFSAPLGYLEGLKTKEISKENSTMVTENVQQPLS
jgi:hypothetical protein